MNTSTNQLSSSFTLKPARLVFQLATPSNPEGLPAPKTELVSQGIEDKTLDQIRAEVLGKNVDATGAATSRLAAIADAKLDDNTAPTGIKYEAISAKIKVAPKSTPAELNNLVGDIASAYPALAEAIPAGSKIQSVDVNADSITIRYRNGTDGVKYNATIHRAGFVSSGNQQ